MGPARGVIHLLGILGTALAGCGAPQQATTATNVLAVEASVEVGGDGLVVRSFLAKGNADGLVSTLGDLGSEACPAERSQRLENDGLFVRKVEMLDLPAIVASVGDIEPGRVDWHGQVYRWRDMQQTAIAAPGVLIAASGTTYLVDRGWLTLLGRSWTVERENGRHVYLQIVPVWHVPGTVATIPGEIPPPRHSRVFEELEVECMLKPGEALLIAVPMRHGPGKITGPQDEGPAAMRLGEAIMGGPKGDEDMVSFIAFEACSSEESRW